MSYDKAITIEIKDHYSVSEFEFFENLSSRFARTVDFLIRKVFHSIDDVEFEHQGTLIDVHERNLFTSIEEIKDL